MTEKKLNKKEIYRNPSPGEEMKENPTNSKLTGLKSEEKKDIDYSAFPQGDETRKREKAQFSKRGGKNCSDLQKLQLSFQKTHANQL